MKKAFAAILSLFLLLAGISAAPAEIKLPFDMPERPNIVPAESVEAFLGSWELCGYADKNVTILDKNNILIALIRITIEITEEEFLMSMDGGTESYKYEFNAENGTLTVNPGKGRIDIVYLYDNGMITMDEQSGSGETTFFYSRVEEPQQ